MRVKSALCVNRILFMHICMLLLILCFLTSCSYSKEVPKAENGILDLTDWDLEMDGAVKLDGEWDFYWKQLLTPEDFAKKQSLDKPNTEKILVQIPKNWNKYKINNESLKSDGYATFRLEIRLKNSENTIGMKLPTIGTSYKLWINGKVYNELGKVGETRKEFSPKYFPDTVYFSPQNYENDRSDGINEIEIIIQVANFMHRRGGIWQSLILGTTRRIKNIREKSLFSDIFLFTGLIIIGFYLVLIYLINRKSLFVLYLGVFSFILSIRTLLLGEMYLVNLLTAVPQELFLKVEYLTLCIGLVFYVLYLELLFPGGTNERICLSFKLSGLLFALFVIFSSASIYNKLLIVIQSIVIIAGIYSIIVLGSMMLKGKKEVILILIGTLFLYGTVINDILFFNEIIFTGSYSSLGLFVFIITHFHVISLHHFAAFSRAKKVSQYLVTTDKLKDDFLIYISNELYSPLKGIIGISESMIEGAAGKLNSIQLSNLSKIIFSARRVFNIVNDIEDFSKIKNNDIILDKKPVDLKQITKLVFELCKPIVSDKKIELNNNINAGIPLVYGDESRIQQIIYNLVSYTVMNTNFGIITVNAETVGEILQVTISDTGGGVPSNVMDSIFESFAHEKLYTGDKCGEACMSLKIAKYLVELHGGKISFRTDQNKGMSFIFTLPIYNEKALVQNAKKRNSRYSKRKHENTLDYESMLDDKSVLEDEGKLKKNSTFTEIDILEKNICQKNSEEYVKSDNFTSIKPDGRFNILVADDDPVNLQVMVNYLSLEGYNVTDIINGEEVISKIRENKEDFNRKYDLLVIDIMMPKISGYEICKTLRNEFTIFELPILMLTRKGQYDDVTTGFKAGANDYISKPFDRRELLTRVGTLLAFKHSVETAIINARNLEAEINRRTFAETLGEFSKTLTSTLELNEVLERLLEKLASFILFDSGIVMLKEGNKFRVVSNIGYFSETCNYSKDFGNTLIESKNSLLIHTVLKNQSPIIIGDAKKDNKYCICKNNSCGKMSFLAVPIVYDSEVLGILLLQDKKKDAFSEYDAEIVYNFAAQSGIAIKNAKLFAEIRKLATIDDLTRLNNRRNFFELAEREFKLFKRYKNPEGLSMIMLDVDDFKKVNDTYGHYMGDDVLRTVAEKCTETLRETDIIGRYGGEEFVVLLPYAGQQEAQKVAKRLSKNISEQPIIFNRLNIFVTVSIGIAVLDDSINTLEELLKMADIALYEAKEKGKNCIVML